MQVIPDPCGVAQVPIGSAARMVGDLSSELPSLLGLGPSGQLSLVDGMCLVEGKSWSGKP